MKDVREKMVWCHQINIMDMMEPYYIIQLLEQSAQTYDFAYSLMRYLMILAK